jgi:hypothetical protein
MQMIENTDTEATKIQGWTRSCNHHLGAVILVEVTVISTQTDGMLGPVEWFPKERAKLSQWRWRWSLQLNGIDSAGAGCMDGSDNGAQFSN